MGKIGLILHFQTEHGPVLVPTQRPRNLYRAILKMDNHTIFDKSFTLASTSVESLALINFSEAMPVFRAEKNGIYQLEISQAGEAEMNLVSAEVQVRNDVVEPNNSVILAGIGLLVSGLAILFL